MLTAGVVLYDTEINQAARLIGCVRRSSIRTLYLVDHSSGREYEPLVKESERIVYIHGQGNIGYGAGHNLALRRSAAQGSIYHIVMNPDITFEPEAIDRMVEFMDRNPGAGAAMPRVLYPDGRLQYLCRLTPTPFDLFMRRFFPLRRTVERMNRRIELRSGRYDEVLNVPCLSGCFLFLRMEALEETGLFDPRYFLYGEDFDLSRRIHRRYETLFFPSASVYHEHKKASYRSLRPMWIHIVSMVRYFNKWGWIYDPERRRFNRRALLAAGHPTGRTFFEKLFRAFKKEKTDGFIDPDCLAYEKCKKPKENAEQSVPRNPG